MNKILSTILVGNGYGKMMGSTQIAELGEIETPIVLTDGRRDQRVPRPANTQITRT